jgi:glycine cleavage system T protein (aminomethyltransferase)
MKPYRVSAMYEAHVALGARFRDDGDWRVPEAYRTSPAAEADAALAAVGLTDASACGTLTLRGEGIDGALAKIAAVERLGVGRAERIRIAGLPVLALRLSSDELWLSAPVAEMAAVLEAVASAAAGIGCAHLTDLTGAFAVLDLIGPRTPELLARLCPLDLAAVPVLAIVQGELARVHATLVRLDRPGGWAVRAWVVREYGASVWAALSEAGHDLGLVPVGAAARARLDEAR